MTSRLQYGKKMHKILNYLQSSHHWIQQFYCYYYCYHFPMRTRRRLTFLRRYRTRLGKEATDVYDSMMLDSIYTGFLPPLNGKNVPFYVITILSGFFLSNYYNHVLQCPSVFLFTYLSSLIIKWAGRGKFDVLEALRGWKRLKIFWSGFLFFFTIGFFLS